ncbi:RpiB/LacA/LacB family sugar-phosphate isomerase [Fontivita pretiosa]|uniref:RpiB/LacA/LacB family sugar-phosphate isomerase n=1 Tax=Fontivita pretiosa TaxID=2989684 RepID=UPI003D166FE0
MIFTARQLEQLHRSNGSNGQVILPYRARLTPLAQDWIRQRGIAVGYSDVEVEASNKPGAAETTEAVEPATQQSRRLLWWCDGPCGPAKAALLTVAREANFNAIEVAVDPRRIVEAVKIFAREVQADRADGGVMLVSSGATAMVYANRCPSLRAVLGTCLEAVDQGTKLVAANVLVIEHPYKTLPQTRALLAKFVKARRVLSEELKRQLSELASCA